MGKVNCERYKQLCSQVPIMLALITMITVITVIAMMCCPVQLTNLLIPFTQAEVTGYPTIRIYNRAEDFLVGEN